EAESVLLHRSKREGTARPPLDALAEYFESRKALFRAPECRKVTVIALSIGDALPWIAVSDADARAKYDSQRSRYVTPERRQLQQIVFPKPEEAKAAAERLKGGESFAALATSRGLKDADIDLGNMSKSEMIDRTVADAAFSLKEGEVSEPVQGQFGSVLVHVVKVSPEQVRTYEELAPEIKREMASERAREEIQEKYNKVEDERAGGAQL